LIIVVAVLVAGIDGYHHHHHHHHRITRIKRRVNVVYGADTIGHTGDWGKLDLCPPGQYVVGFALKSEKNRGVHDDTALNGVRLRCNGGGTVASTVQKWGHWTPEQVCHGGAVYGFQIQIESVRGVKDDTAANNVNLVCKIGGHHRILHGRSLTHWGKWSHWLKCRNGMVAVGIQTRVQEAKGWLKDDSALNGMKLLCAGKVVPPTPTPSVPTVTLRCRSQKAGEDCWPKCGGKGGRCNACGPLGYCCRKGYTDCPAKMASILAHGSHHSCVSCHRKGKDSPDSPAKIFLTKVSKKVEEKPQKDEKEDTKVNNEEVKTVDVEDVAQDAVLDNSEQEKKAVIKDEILDKNESRKDEILADEENKDEALGDLKSNVS